MDTLQKAWDETIRAQLNYSNISTIYISRKCKERGIELTPKQFAYLKKQLSMKNFYSLRMDLNPDQEEQLRLSNKNEEINITLFDSENEIEKIFKDLMEKITEKLPTMVDEISDVILQDLKRTSGSMLKYQKGQRNGFERRLNKRWKKPFKLLEMIHVISFETGEAFNDEFRGNAAQENDFVFDVLTRMHARACQISSEIIRLLECGFADGAMARWRTMHEIEVTSSFIKKHGVDVAERYLLHNHIESYKASLSYLDNMEKLDLEPLADEELINLKKIKDELINRYGESYSCNYGWASDVLKNKNPKFDQIEKDVGLEHLRPYYRLASHNVHANPKGILFKMGLFGNEDILLAGPSNYGLADPGQLCAISLSNITTLLLMHKPNIDNLVTCKILQTLIDETSNAFVDVQKQIEKEEQDIKQDE